MQLMRYVFKMDFTVRFEDENRMFKYEVLSIVIHRIMGLLEDKVLNEYGNKEL